LAGPRDHGGDHDGVLHLAFARAAPIADFPSVSSGGGSTAGKPSDSSKHHGRDTPVEREKSRAT
jgi:hypothetical protein